MTTGGVNKKDFDCLTNIPPGDANFKYCLERAGVETIQAALAEIAGEAGNKVREKALKAQLQRLSREAVETASEAAMEVVQAEQSRETLAQQEQVKRERLIAEYHQAVGQIKTANMFAEFASISSLVWIQQMRETKAYRELGTWESFCESIGFTRQHVEDQLKNLAFLGEKFLQTVCGLGVGYRELRKLRQLTHEGTVCVEDNAVTIGDECIPLDAEHREDLQAALERVIDAKDALLQEKDINLRTKERLIQDKQKLIERQAKDLARYEGEAEKKGLSADEEAFIKQCTTARVTIDGFFAKFDPDCNPLPENATPRMKAALMETLGYFKRVIDATYDTAGDLYGDAELDGNGWVQPNLRAAGEFLASARQKKTGQEG